MNKNLNQIVPLIRDLQELDRLTDMELGRLRKKNGGEHKDGIDANHRPTEIEKKLNQLKQLIAKMLALLTKKPRNADEEALMKAKFRSLSREMMFLLAEIESLLNEEQRERAAGRIGKANSLAMFIAMKRAQYARAA
ncbi:MAG: hypothetical protein LBI17_01420 [Rickettsiales bacterium]|jgi:hypothetical protein|nr:hypothetical protein [Rickettsiales bacterium]